LKINDFTNKYDMAGHKPSFHPPTAPLPHSHPPSTKSLCESTYQALEDLHREIEKNSLSSCLYEFEESAADHFHQEGLSQLEPPIVLAYKPQNQNV
jgi:hypothetical protein